MKYALEVSTEMESISFKKTKMQTTGEMTMENTVGMKCVIETASEMKTEMETDGEMKSTMEKATALKSLLAMPSAKENRDGNSS